MDIMHKRALLAILCFGSASWTASVTPDGIRAVQYTHIIDPAMNDGYHLLAADAVSVRPSLVTALYARHIAAHQKHGLDSGCIRW